MNYNVAQLLREPIGSIRSYQLDEKFTGPKRWADSIAGPVQMVRVHDGILVRATVEVRSNLTCCRCLGEYPSASKLMIEDEFFPTVDPQTGRKTPHPEETALIDNNHVLDLTGITNEYFITNMPMKPLCKSNCKGLCQVCGTNQNLVSCECVSQTMDPRWSALVGLSPED